jgi:two-component system phosphate regulon sensor histidine kinase PhoR
VDKGRLDGGTGLGLAIVKHIVMKYDGTIKLESGLSKGTKITNKLKLSM